eukprot:SAG31_NODE_8147_length_1511_cov_1.215297_1_plen_357_part_10
MSSERGGERLLLSRFCAPLSEKYGTFTARNSALIEKVPPCRESPEMAGARGRHNEKCGIKEWDAHEIERRMQRRMLDLERARLRRTFDVSAPVVPGRIAASATFAPPAVLYRSLTRRQPQNIDEDGSGLIEPGEWRRLCRRLAPHLSDAEMQATFNRIDVDGSGEIDFDEFAEWWDSPDGKRLRGVEEQAAEEERRYAMLREQYAKDQKIALESARLKQEEHARRAAAFARREAAATKLQAAARGRLARQRWRRQRFAFAVLQKMARGKKARARFANLLPEHRRQRLSKAAEDARRFHCALLVQYGVDRRRGGCPVPKLCGNPSTQLEASRRNLLHDIQRSQRAVATGPGGQQYMAA